MNLVVPLFSTPIYIGEIDVTSDDKTHCAALPKSEGAFHDFLISHEDRVLDDPLLDELKKCATLHVKKYATDVYKINQDTFDFYINTSWVSDLNSESAVELHKHYHSIFTGVIVLECGGLSRLILESRTTPIMSEFLRFGYNEHNIFNSSEEYFDLIPNHIYLFPSNLGHSAKCFLPGGNLSVIAFDTFIRGNIGKHSSNLTFN
jgi:hypothetical protein